MKKKLAHLSSGFTLLEILIAMSFLFMILFVITSFGLDIANFGGFLGDNLSTEQELQQTFKVIKTELRSMGPANNGGYPIESATATSFIFYSDIDGDGLFERVRYYLEGSILKKGIITPTGSPWVYLSANEKTREVVHYIIPNPPPIFSYYPKDVDGGGAALVMPVDPSVIRLLKLDISADRDPLQLPKPSNLKIWVTMRNFRGTN
ncbi:MAG: prepilin-type N-terminal cleavage/methylation domain-containing protein [bacterium]|nr:prepilin-type N-terminal cleavage/methylation domain-containing protein [bacterium]